MGRIPGYYEWDDEKLSPGKRKGGGLHQNLFDDDGKLRGNARFIPDDQVTANQIYAPDRDYQADSNDQQAAWQAEMIAALVRELAPILIEKVMSDGLPVVKRWWRSSLRPFLTKRFQSVRSLLSRRDHHPDIVDPPVLLPLSNDVSNPEDRDTDSNERATIPLEEAQLRMLSIFAAQTFIEQQLIKLSQSTVETSQQLEDMKHTLSAMSEQDLRALLTVTRDSLSAHQLDQLALGSPRRWEIES